MNTDAVYRSARIDAKARAMRQVARVAMNHDQNVPRLFAMQQPAVQAEPVG